MRVSAGAVVSAARRASAIGAERIHAAAAWSLIYLLFQAGLGLAWDIGWHRSVGRDTFWTPPHVLLYSGVALGGLVCLAVVLFDSVARGDDSADDTLAIVGPLRAPLGFALAGFGYLTLLAAAPLDDYWHRLYGLDVTLWAPFHMMGLIGAAIAGTGATYAIASCAARARRAHVSVRVLEAGVVLALAGLLDNLLVIAQPSAALYPTTQLLGVEVLTFPVLLAAFVTPILFAAARAVAFRFAATGVVGVLVARDLFFALVTPAVVRIVAGIEGTAFRTARPPEFQPVPLVVPLLLLVPALLVDVRLRAEPSRRADASLVAAALVAIGTTYVVWVRRSISRADLPPELAALLPTADPVALAILLAIPLAVAAAALSAPLGDGWGRLLRLNPH